MYWIVIRANTDSIHTTIHTIIHAKYIVHVLVCIAIRSNKYQHVLACITLVFGMYEIMIRANTDQKHAFFPYVPILTPIHSPIRAQYNQIQTYTSSNTDQYKHHRPIHTSSFQYLLFNMPIQASVVDSVLSNKAPPPAPPRPPLQVCQRYLSLPSCTQPHSSSSSAYSSSVLWDSRTFHAAANFSSADSVECRFIAVCLVTRIAVNAHSSESSDWWEAGILKWGRVCKGTTASGLSTVGSLWLLYNGHLLEQMTYKKWAVVDQLQPCRLCWWHPRQRFVSAVPTWAQSGLRQSPVSSFLGRLPLIVTSVQLFGTPASDTSWWCWHHSAQHARQDGYALSWGWMWQHG